MSPQNSWIDQAGLNQWLNQLVPPAQKPTAPDTPIAAAALPKSPVMEDFQWPAAPSLPKEPPRRLTTAEPLESHFSLARTAAENSQHQPVPTTVETRFESPFQLQNPGADHWEEVTHQEIPSHLIDSALSLRERIHIFGSWILGQNIANGYCLLDQDGGVLAEENFNTPLFLVASDLTRAWKRLEKAGGLPGERMSMPFEDAFLNVIPCSGIHGLYTFACRSPRALSLPLARRLGIALKEFLET